MFSCRTRGFCPSCHAKRLEEWGDWMRETLLLDVPHRQVVFVIPKMLRIFFKYNRRFLGSPCRCALWSLTRYFEITAGSELMPGVIAVIQTFGDRYGKEAKDLERMDYLEFIARVTSHIPDKGWAEMIRKVYEVDPMVCPHCGGQMKIITFLTDYAVVDRIIGHLKLNFVAERPPPAHLAYQEVLMAAESSAEYLS